MIRVQYCAKCINELEGYGELAIAVYERICEHIVQFQECYLIETDPHFKDFCMVEIVKFLEYKGYVLTTEACKTSLLVKPLGHQILAENSHRFCVKSHHE